MGTFSSTCLSEPVSNSLLTLLQVLLEGASGIQNTGDQKIINARTCVASTTSHSLISNAVKCTTNVQMLYQLQERETAVPVYVGLKLHAHECLNSLIREFHQVGLTFSYDRIMDVRRRLAQTVSKRFKDESVVVPTKCKCDIFPTATIDNIDVSGRNDMHGTSITLIGHLSKINTGTNPLPLTMDVL